MRVLVPLLTFSHPPPTKPPRKKAPFYGGIEGNEGREKERCIFFLTRSCEEKSSPLSLSAKPRRKKSFSSPMSLLAGPFLRCRRRRRRKVFRLLPKLGFFSSKKKKEASLAAKARPSRKAKKAPSLHLRLAHWGLEIQTPISFLPFQDKKRLLPWNAKEEKSVKIKAREKALFVSLFHSSLRRKFSQIRINPALIQPEREGRGGSIVNEIPSLTFPCLNRDIVTPPVTSNGCQVLKRSLSPIFCRNSFFTLSYFEGTYLRPTSIA